MMESLASGLLIHSVQSSVLIGIAALGALMLPWPGASGRLRYWRAVLALCLALPVISLTALAPASPLGRLTVDVVASTSRVQPFGSSSGWSLLALLALAWLVGVGGRLAWLLLGARQLHRLRLGSTDLGGQVLDSELREWRDRMAPHAEVRSHAALDQPVSFGWRRPLVLLPPAALTLDRRARTAVVCHELLHVRRHDWPWRIAEEIVRAVFWFHPAVWWVLDRIHVQREACVDELVVASMQERRAYMETLLFFADRASAPAAAIPFVRGSHVKARLQHLSAPAAQNARARWKAPALVAVLAVALAAALACAGQGRVRLPSEEGVVPPVMISGANPQYPAAALSAKIGGTVNLQGVVRPDGTIDDIVVTQSLDREYGLDEAAVAALRECRFEPGTVDGKPVPVQIEVVMSFTVR